MKTEDLQRDLLLFLYEYRETEEYRMLHSPLIKYKDIDGTVKQMLIHLKGIGVIEVEINDNQVVDSRAKLTPIEGYEYVMANYIRG